MKLQAELEKRYRLFNRQETRDGQEILEKLQELAVHGSERHQLLALRTLLTTLETVQRKKRKP